MAVLGLIKHVSGLLYRDMATGQFLSWAEASPIVERARFYGYQSKTLAAGMEKSARTLSELYGLGDEGAKTIIDEYLAKYKNWREGGNVGDKPYMESPEV